MTSARYSKDVIKKFLRGHLVNIKHRLTITPAIPGGDGLNQLIAAAFISPDLQALLLTDPLAAAKKGYGGEPIALSPAEESLLLSVSGAGTLAELCMRLAGHRFEGGKTL